MVFLKIMHIAETMATQFAQKSLDFQVRVNVSAEVASLGKRVVAIFVIANELSFLAVGTEVVEEFTVIVKNLSAVLAVVTKVALK
jgi:hypothetical protein